MSNHLSHITILLCYYTFIGAVSEIASGRVMFYSTQLLLEVVKVVVVVVVVVNIANMRA